MIRQVAIVTPNPTLDTIYTDFQYGLYDKSFYGSSRQWAGGSGINVARGLKDLGVAARTLTIFGGDSGESARRALAAEGLEVRAIPGLHATRTTSIEYRIEGRRMAVSPSPDFTATSIAELVAACRPVLECSAWIFFGGSFPAAADRRELLLELLGPYRQRLVVDTRSKMLQGLVDLSPYCLKLDSTDFLEPSGGVEMSWDRVLENARRAHAAGAALVCAEAAGRLLAVYGGGARVYPWFGENEDRPYGRGDALMAGLLSGLFQGLDPDRCVRLGILAARACGPRTAGLGSIDARKLRDGMALLDGLAPGELR